MKLVSQQIAQSQTIRDMIKRNKSKTEDDGKQSP